MFTESLGLAADVLAVYLSVLLEYAGLGFLHRRDQLLALMTRLATSMTIWAARPRLPWGAEATTPVAIGLPRAVTVMSTPVRVLLTPAEVEALTATPVKTARLPLLAAAPMPDATESEDDLLDEDTTTGDEDGVHLTEVLDGVHCAVDVHGVQVLLGASQVVEGVHAVDGVQEGVQAGVHVVGSGVQVVVGAFHSSLVVGATYACAAPSSCQLICTEVSYKVSQSPHFLHTSRCTY